MLPTPSSDRILLRDLATRLAEAAALPEQAEKVRLWQRLNALRPERPMVFVNPQGGWRELVREDDLRCEDPTARSYERQLRMKLFRHQHIPDDFPITGTLDVGWSIRVSSFGVEEHHERSDPLGAYHIDPPIKTPRDFARLKPRAIEVDHGATERAEAEAQELVGDILEVRRLGEATCRCMITRIWIHLRGLDRMMLDMYDEPNLMHEAMSFLQGELIREWELYEREGVLTRNDLADSITGSGGIAAEERDGSRVPPSRECGSTAEEQKHPPLAARMGEMWCWAEAQECVGVGPQQFNEFVLQYQLPMMARFRLVDYGCCEPLDQKLDLILASIPHLRWVSISPWANRALAAEKLQDRYVYVYKPNPSHLCSPRPDWTAAEKELRETLDMARGCCVSLIMKDTHTFHHDPTRVTRWAKMARCVVEDSPRMRCL